MYINNQNMVVPEGTTVLEAVRKAGFKVPTLCNMEWRRPIGACRVCLVEMEGSGKLVASCTTPVAEGMRILTNSRKARNARKLVVELLVSEHEGDCKTCERNDDCELQSVAREMGVYEIPYTGDKPKHYFDKTTPALIRDTAKCIKCRRCVTVCTETENVGAIFPQGRGYSTTIAPGFNINLSDIACVQCGQCSAVCPVGAIVEKSSIEEIWKEIDNPNKTVVVQTAPAIRAALGEAFGLPPGTLVTGKMVTALRQLGFDKVFDTDFTADLTIMEEGTELLMRLKKALVDKEEVPLPQYTSCCPAWIKYAEYYHPEILPNLSSCKSPQQMFGAVAKTYYADLVCKEYTDMTVVSVMPCTAKKFECQRDEMNDSGIQDVDYVVTTRELAKMIKQSGIDFVNLPEGKMDSPIGAASGAADIFANTGGVMEAAIRTAYEIATGRELPLENLHVQPIMGLDNYKTAALLFENCLPEWSFLNGVELKVGVVHGLKNAERIIQDVKNGETFHFIEVMTCPGGCISGGGQPRFTTDEVRMERMKAIYAEDEGKELRKSHENPEVIEIYRSFLTSPCGHKSHELLHTKYIKREIV